MLKIFKNKDLKMSKLLDLWTKLCTLTTYFQNIKAKNTRRKTQYYMLH